MSRVQTIPPVMQKKVFPASRETLKVGLASSTSLHAASSLLNTIAADGIITHITGAGTAFPPNVFTQDEMRQLLGVENPTVVKLLRAPHIKTRSMYLPREEYLENGDLKPLGKETSQQLHQRFIHGLRDIGTRAGLNALNASSLRPTDIDVVVAVTSSGLALPGFSAILIQELGMRSDVHRSDIVGMGCNAGMSGLRALSSLVREKSRRSVRPIRGLLVCSEINSAIYVNNSSTGTGIVNSLFGDGAASFVLTSEGNSGFQQRLSINNALASVAIPQVALVDFETATLVEYFDDMQYVVDPSEKQLNFKLSKQIPFVVGTNAPKVVHALLKRNKLAPGDVSEWVIHTGGAKVIEGFAKGLGIDEETSMRHTTSVLRDYGNLSSGSFMVSFERLMEEIGQNYQRGLRGVKRGDIFVLVAMGPGTTIEAGVAVVTQVPTNW